MKKNTILILSFLCFVSIQVISQTKTPTGISIYSQSLPETFSAAQIAAADAVWQDSIINAPWSAQIIGSCASTYNCHGYAWHMSDGGNAIWLPNVADVIKYFSGTSPTYRVADGPQKYVKVYYDGAAHSGIVDSNNITYIISKWGSGPLVRHLPDDCPYNSGHTPYTKKYYELIIDETPTSVAKGCAVNVSTLNISNATYSWSEENDNVCASGSSYTGEITGLDMTTGSERGKVKVEINSQNSNTIVKGLKEFVVTSPPASPYITMDGADDKIICSDGRTFRLNNVPPGNTITWTSSSNLNPQDLHGNPCTFVSTGSGIGHVGVTLSTDCDENTFDDIDDFEIWSGTPVITSISGPSSAPNNQWAYYTAQLQNSKSSPDDYTWNLSPLNGNSVYDYGIYGDIAFYNAGYYQLSVQAHNTCGSGNYAVKGINVYDTYSMVISPNPATTEITISMESDVLGESSLKSASTTSGNFEGEVEWEYEIYSTMQILKAKKTKIKGKTKLNIQSWKEGVYTVRVKYKDQILTGKFVKQ